MAGKLALDRDFTRFINDETFPYKVTVCIGDERVVCSGVLLAQQSKVLERKFREDDGVLLFEEMLEVENSKQVLHECIAYLHGADLSFSRENVEVILKFSSWYEIKDLFTKALVWLRKDLNSTRSVELVVNYLKVSNSLNTSDSVDLKSDISKFIGANKEVVGLELDDYLELGLTGFDIALIIEQNPSNSGNIMKKWAAISVDHKNFILENNSLYNFKQIFPNEDDFSSFVSYISDKASSVESMKALLDIQKVYFTTKKVQKGERKEIGTPDVPIPTSGAPKSKLEHLNLREDRKLSNRGWYFSSDKSLSVNIYNVPHSATPERLINLFKSVGRIDSITIHKREMTAMVVFQDAASVSRLFNSHCNYSMDGMLLQIGEHIENNSVYDTQEVYIGNLPPSTTKNKLIQLFKFAGKIVNIELYKDSAFALLTFENVDSANVLLSSGRRFMLDGYTVDVQECSESDEDESTVYIGNVPKSATKDNLKRLFGGFGRIDNITMKRKRDIKYAFVEFENEGSALALIRSCASKTYELQGNILKIAKSKRN